MGMERAGALSQQQIREVAIPELCPPDGPKRRRNIIPGAFQTTKQPLPWITVARSLPLPPPRHPRPQSASCAAERLSVSSVPARTPNRSSSAAAGHGTPEPQAAASEAIRCAPGLKARPSVAPGHRRRAGQATRVRVARPATCDKPACVRCRPQAAANRDCGIRRDSASGRSGILHGVDYTATIRGVDSTSGTKDLLDHLYSPRSSGRFLSAGVVGARGLHSHLPRELVGGLSKRLALAPHLASFSIFICHWGTHPGRYAQRFRSLGTRQTRTPSDAPGAPVARTACPSTGRRRRHVATACGEIPGARGEGVPRWPHEASLPSRAMEVKASESMEMREGARRGVP